MGKKALRKEFFMEIRTSLGRFLSIFFIVAIGVAFFSGIRATEPDMRFSGDAYFDEKRMADLQIISTLGLTEEDIHALEELDGVEKVEYGYSVDALCQAKDSSQAVHVMSILPTMNVLTVEEGRLPGKENECVVDVDYLESGGFSIGDKICLTSGKEDEITDTLTTDTFTIVGAVSSPCYIGFHRGSTTIGTGSIAGFVCVPEESFRTEVYTELYLSVKEAAGLTEFTDAYTDRIEEVKKQIKEIQKEREEARTRGVREEAQEKITDAKQELADARGEAEEELAKAERELTDGRKKLEDGKGQIETSSAQLEQAKARLLSGEEELYRQAGQANAQGRQLNQKIEEYNRQVEEYNRQSQLLESQRTLLEEQSAALERQREQIAQEQAKLEEQSVQLAQWETQLVQERSALDAAIQQWSTLKAQYDILASGNPVDPDTLALLHKMAEELAFGEQQIAAGEEALAASRKQWEEAQAALTAGQNQMAAAWQQLEAGQAQIETARIELDAGEQQLKTAAGQLSQAPAQFEQAEKQLSGAQTQLDAAQAEITKGWQQSREGESELLSARREIAEKEKELSDGEKEYARAKAEADAKIADGEKDLEDAETKVREIESAKWYLRDRDDFPEHAGYGENADRMRAIGKVFPVLFFLVAALISLTTMTRMVEEQRTQIGTLKALGYERRAIAGKYLGYACVATLTGSIAGVLFGEKVFPFVIITAYGIMYEHIPNVVIPYNIQYAFMASAAALICTLLATFFSCSRELREQAAELMRPPAPRQGKRIFLERMGFFWNRLSFTWKATLRNLIRYKKRFFMTIFGIGGCMALLLVGFGLKDSIFDIGLLQYHELQLYDGNLILNEDATEAERTEACEKLAADARVERTSETLLKQVTIGCGDTKGDVYLNVPKEAEPFFRFVVHRDRITKEVYSLEEDGVILTEKMAKKLGVAAGDSIYIQDEEKGELEVVVSAVCENYMQHYLYMTSSLYEKIYGKTPEYQSVYFMMKEGRETEQEEVGEEILREKGALSISYTSDIETQLNDMLVSLNIVMVVLVISAGMLAFVVLYNLNNINITERKRELATLKVLGFYPGEVAQYVYRENMILTVLGALAGILLGKFLHQFVIVTVEIDSAMFGRNIDFSSFVYGFLITVAFSVFVNGVMYFKLKKINMVESLKSVE